MPYPLPPLCMTSFYMDDWSSWKGVVMRWRESGQSLRAGWDLLREPRRFLGESAVEEMNQEQFSRSIRRLLEEQQALGAAMPQEGSEEGEGLVATGKGDEPKKALDKGGLLPLAFTVNVFEEGLQNPIDDGEDNTDVLEEGPEVDKSRDGGLGSS